MMFKLLSFQLVTMAAHAQFFPGFVPELGPGPDNSFHTVFGSKPGATDAPTAAPPTAAPVEPTTCNTCVAQNRAWQGTCMPSDRCLIADLSCVTTSKGCEALVQQDAAAEKCKAATDCQSCTAADAVCGWSISSASCFMAANVFFNSGLVARNPEQCPVVIEPVVIEPVVIEPACMCPRILRPVCDVASGKKYNNACLARCAGAANTGPCPVTDPSPVVDPTPAPTPVAIEEEDDDACMCARIFRPVCDVANGKKYNNACLARCAGASDVGPCPAVDPVIDPVEPAPCPKPSAVYSEIRPAAASGLCLDVNGPTGELLECNNSDGQAFTFENGSLRAKNGLCLNDGVTVGECRANTVKIVKGDAAKAGYRIEYSKKACLAARVLSNDSKKYKKNKLGSGLQAPPCGDQFKRQYFNFHLIF